MDLGYYCFNVKCNHTLTNNAISGPQTVAGLIHIHCWLLLALMARSRRPNQSPEHYFKSFLSREDFPSPSQNRQFIICGLWEEGHFSGLWLSLIHGQNKRETSLFIKGISGSNAQRNQTDLPSHLHRRKLDRVEHP